MSGTTAKYTPEFSIIRKITLDNRSQGRYSDKDSTDQPGTYAPYFSGETESRDIYTCTVSGKAGRTSRDRLTLAALRRKRNSNQERNPCKIFKTSTQTSLAHSRPHGAKTKSAFRVAAKRK
jgi:hypothetical protein